MIKLKMFRRWNLRLSDYIQIEISELCVQRNNLNIKTTITIIELLLKIIEFPDNRKFPKK